MSASAYVRRKIYDVEAAIKNAGTPAALNAIVETLKEIANALDDVEKRALPGK
jgi:uncharacterized protein (DUF2164 family)